MKKPTKISAKKGVLCPRCQGDRSEVRRTTRKPGVTVRERRCLECGRKWPTFERNAAATGSEIVTYVDSLMKALSNTPRSPRTHI